MSSLSWAGAGTAVAALRELGWRVLVEPVRDGRLRSAGWPAGLRAVFALSVLAAAACIVLIITSPLLRSALPLGAAPSGTTWPQPLLWIALSVAMLALATFQTGALHTRWWLRVTALLVTFSVFSAFASTTLINNTALLTGGAVFGCWLLLVVLQLARLQRRFAWWEFVVVLAVDMTAMIISLSPRLQTRSIALEGELVAAAQESLVYVGLLAVPVALAAGFAVAQLALSTVVWSADLTRRHLPGRALLVLVIMVATWRAVAEGLNLTESGSVAVSLVGAAVLLAAAVAIWLALDRLADRADGRLPADERTRDTGVRHLGEQLVAATLPIGAVLALAGLVSFFAVAPLYGVGLAQVYQRPALAAVFGTAQVIPGLVGGGLAATPGRVALAGAMLAVAVWLAWRGRRGLAEFVGVVAVVRIAVSVTDPLYVLDLLPLLATAWLIGLLVLWGVRRRLSLARQEGLLAGLLVCAVFGSRQVFADPFELVIGGAAAVLLGLVWGFLTGSADANHDTPAYPRSSRVLMLIGNALIGFALLAFIALARDRVNTLDLLYQQEQGDLLLGGGLLICALLAISVALLRDREIGAPAS